MMAEHIQLVRAAAAMEAARDDYLSHYEFDDGDHSHIPNEIESVLIDDAITGLLDDERFVDAFVAWRLLTKDGNVPQELELLVALREARVWIEDALEQLAIGDRVDLSDSLRLALKPVVAAITFAEAPHAP